MYSDNNDFNSILSRLLDNVDDGLDKREGSIIYDALAPAAAELAQCYVTLDIYKEQTYLLTALGENLDNKVAEAGITRIEATPSQVIINIYDNDNALMDVDLSSKFSAPNEYGGYNYRLISRQSTGVYIAECETEGIAGNTYIGDLLPLQSINNLGNATIVSIYKQGEDTEDDETLRARTLLKINQESFAGNKAAYRQMCIELDGVEDCKVYPVWNGGGTVKLALIGPNHTLLSQSEIDAIQQKIDPVAILSYTCAGTESGQYYFTYNGTNYQFTMPLLDTFITNILDFYTDSHLLRLRNGQTIGTTSGNSGTKLIFTPSSVSNTGIGLAPIGHSVTVVTPTQQNISITALLTLEQTSSISQLQSAIEEQLYNYIYQVQSDFVNKNTLTIYTSKITAAILNIREVLNVSQVRINNSTANYTINNSAGTTIKYPVLTEVILHATT